MKPELNEDTEPGHCASTLLVAVPLLHSIYRCLMSAIDGGISDLCPDVFGPVLFSPGEFVGLHVMRAGQP
jgi:hypothetical protein